MTNKIFYLILSFSLLSCNKNEIPKPIQQNTNTILINPSDEKIILDGLNKINTAVNGNDNFIADIGFYKQLSILANDIDGLYVGVDELNNYEQKYIKLRENIRARIAIVDELADQHFNGKNGKIILATNIFVLMTYDALTNYQPDFMWARLGIFAANEVRNGIILSYQIRDIMVGNNIDFMINGQSATEILKAVPEALIEGQLNVLTDIGALDLLNKYGPEKMINAQWLTPEAKNGYSIQLQAQNALINSDISNYQDLQTLAAIEMGAHEQIYILQPLWDKPVLTQFATLNEFFLLKTNGKTSIFGDIFLGTNKYFEFPFGFTIKIPANAYNLQNASNRVEIARNGFNTLNRLRKISRWENWLNTSQAKIGNLDGVYNLNGIRTP